MIQSCNGYKRGGEQMPIWCNCEFSKLMAHLKKNSKPNGKSKKEQRSSLSTWNHGSITYLVKA